MESSAALSQMPGPPCSAPLFTTSRPASPIRAPISRISSCWQSRRPHSAPACSRWRERWHHRRSIEMPLRSAGPALQGRGNARLPYTSANRSAEIHLQRSHRPPRQNRVPWIHSRRRDGLGQWIIGQDPTGPSGLRYVENYFRYIVTGDPKWNVLTADPAASLRQSREKAAADLDSNNPGLSKLATNGGKLILYHGWNDQAISPWNTVNYYKSVQRQLGAVKVDSFLRLYMAPGVEHCAGGPGPSSFGQFGLPTARGSKYGLFDS